MPLKIDFVRDVAAQCVAQLTTAGYNIQPTDDDEAIYAYVSVRHRRVRTRPRTVRKASYSVPAHLVSGEQQFLAKVEAGADLWPHQSRKISKMTVEDGMLNDFGIQHFHLGTTSDPRHKSLIAGTKELLFAIVEDDFFYAIGIYDHTWTKQAVLDVVHATWPQMTEPFTLKGAIGLSCTYTDDDVGQLRAAGINALQQRSDGTVQIGRGGGVASDGSSVAVRRETDRFLDAIEELQNAVVATLEPYVAAGRLPADATVKVVWQGDEIHAVTDPPVFACNLTGGLVIPPL